MGRVDSERSVPVDPSAVLWSARAAELNQRPLLVLLHGIGASESDLFALSPYLPLEPVIASLRAPLPHGPGFSWYPLGNGNTGTLEVTAAAHGILDWLAALPGNPAVALLGFSQGGAMGTQLLRLAPDRFSCLVQLSGYAPGGHVPGDRRLAARKPPVFWGRGTLDQVIPQEAIRHTDAWLAEHSTPTARIYEDLGHSVSAPEIGDVAAFLRQHLRP